MTDFKLTNSDLDCALPTSAKPAKASAPGSTLALGPNIPCTPRKLRLNFHVIQKTDGTGNFPNFAMIPKYGANVIAGSLVSLPDTDGGRPYGITETGEIAAPGTIVEPCATL